jgi:hydrogenase-1 operon protein HyaE
MSLQLSPGPTSLDRLQNAIVRMQSKHGFQRVEGDSPTFPAGLAALLVTEDPQRNLEVLDACVILPEALKPLGEQVARLVAGPDTAPALMQQYGIARAPAVVFLRDGHYIGSLNGIRDWNEYQAELDRLLSGPAQPKPIGIPVRVAANQGACV